MPTADQIVAWVAALIVALGGAKFGAAGLRAIGRALTKKDSAEGSAILVNSASEYAKQITTEHNKLRAEFDDYRRRQDLLFRQHAEWDVEVRIRLLQLGETVPAPPPLYDLT